MNDYNRLLAARARTGDQTALKELLSFYGIYQHWNPETLRVRWDGARALLVWWQKRAGAPLLDGLTSSDGQVFIEEQVRQLKTSILRTYLKGARATLEAIHWGWGIPSAWAGLKLPQQRRSLPTWHFERFSPGIQGKLKALRGLLATGLGLPLACSLEWKDVDLGAGRMQTRRGNLRLSAQALLAIRELKVPRKTDSPKQEVLGWKADTARQWRRRAEDFRDA